MPVLFRKWRKKIREGLRLKWTLAWFRFFVSIRKGDRALDYLYRIQLPDAEVNDATFQIFEQKIWHKYIDKKGNFIPITWKHSLWFLFKTLVLVFVVMAVVVGVQRRINPLTEIEKAIREFQTYIKQTNIKPTDTKQVFQLIDGDSVTVDMSLNPVVKKGRLYLPAGNTEKGESGATLVPAASFKGDSIALGDRAFVRTFIHTSGDTTYYLHSLQLSLEGSWISPQLLKTLRAMISTTEDTFKAEYNLLTFKLQAAVKLRKLPNTSGELVLTLPAGDKIQLMKIGLLSSESVWIYVSYVDSLGQAYEGWMAAYHKNKQFIETSQP